MRFLTQSCTVWRRSEHGADGDGLAVSSWAAVATEVACRVMHDAGVAVGAQGGTVQTPRCYFEVDADIDGADEIEIDGKRYAIEQKFGPAEGGNHYTVVTLRSGALS